MSAPRPSSPWLEPEAESSFAITTDALMKPRQNERAASRRVVRSRRTGRTFPLGRPSAPACQRLRDAVKGQTTRAPLAHPTADVITALNRIVRGWAGYFHFQHCGRAFSALRRFLTQRVRIYLRRKHRTQSWGYQAFPDSYLYGRLGLYRLPGAPYQAPASTLR